jgi:serine/threonine protein kinase
VHTFQIKNWFLNSLAGEPISPDEREIDEELLQRVESGFANVLKLHRQEVEALNRLLKIQVARKGFSQSRLQIENIASNLLQLLDRVKEKRIALRDLKPDNLFLDANPDEYPVFLNDVESFAIGVIDVETAISLVPDNDGYVAQPLLGGTPLYATPLHLLKNRTIASHFGDVAEMLHLQDWFATIAIIFKAVSGRNLFRRSARSFPAVLKILKSGPSKTDPDEATVKAMNRKFWSAAAQDMKASLMEFSDPLNQLSLAVPESMVPPISAELKREAACLDTAIRKHVTYSPLFKSEKNKTFLLEASDDTIAKQISKWNNVQSLPDHHLKVAPQMVSFLKNLNRLKSGLAEKRKAIADIAASYQKVSAYSILEAMFQITFRAMYKSEWKGSSPQGEAVLEEAAVKENRSLVTTILNED